MTVGTCDRMPPRYDASCAPLYSFLQSTATDMRHSESPVAVGTQRNTRRECSTCQQQRRSTSATHAHTSAHLEKGRRALGQEERLVAAGRRAEHAMGQRELEMGLEQLLHVLATHIRSLDLGHANDLDRAEASAVTRGHVLVCCAWACRSTGSAQCANGKRAACIGVEIRRRAKA